MKNSILDLLAGIDVSKEISLFEYGLLIAPYTDDGKDDEYFVVYSIGNNLFDTGHICESSINDLINGKGWASKNDINSFLSFNGQSIEEWMQAPMSHKLRDCLQFWGYQNIMGESYSYITPQQARELYF